jgi:hypothetical protein
LRRRVRDRIERVVRGMCVQFNLEHAGV